MTAILDTIIALGLFAIGLLIVAGVWIVLGRPEHICPGCDMPDSECTCEDE